MVTVPLPNKNGYDIVIAVGGGGSGGTIGGSKAEHLSLLQCKWQKHLNQLSTPWNVRFPNEVAVYNSKTGKHRIYVRLNETDPRFDQDGWDGEQMVYRTHSPTNSAEYLVLYHGG